MRCSCPEIILLGNPGSANNFLPMAKKSNSLFFKPLSATLSSIRPTATTGMDNAFLAIFTNSKNPPGS